MTPRMNPEALRLLAEYNAIRGRVHAATDKRSLLTQLSTRQLAGLALSVIPFPREARQLLIALQKTHAQGLSEPQRKHLQEAIDLLGKMM